MKKVSVLLAIFLIFGFSVNSQEQLNFKFSNAKIIAGTPDLMQFDIEIKVDNPGTFHRDLQVYLDYNTLAFGEDAVANGKISISALELMSSHYSTVSLVDNTTSKFAFISEAIEELNYPGTADYFSEVPVEYTGFIRVQMEIADANALAGIYFDEELMNGGQYMQSTTSTDPIAYADPSIFENDLMDFSFIAHEINLASGWAGISSYMLPYDADIENIFDPIVDELVILQNFYGVYYPTYNVNTLGDWDQNSGYLVKVSENCQLRIFGNAIDGGTLELSSGWNLIPVISPCDVNTEDLFNGILGDLIIVKEVAGVGVYWPAQGVNNMPNLNPGKSYFVKLTGDQTITFPGCE